MSEQLKPLVLVTEGSDPEPLDWLRERCKVVEAAADSRAFDETAHRATGLVVRTYTRVDAALLERMPMLKVVGRGGVGLENIDVPACRSRGVEVVYTPEANTVAVGDFVLGLMIRLLRPFGEFAEAPDPAEFKRVRATERGRQLDEITLGILGMGRVGRRVGRIASLGFGTRVIYNDLLDVGGQVDFPATAVDKETLWRESDVLSLHITMRPGNEKLIDAGVLGRMKRGSVVINTSRGEVLDAEALAAAMRSGHLAGASLDVFDPEPPDASFPLLGVRGVILTSHMAARTHTALGAMAWVVRDVVRVLDGQAPAFPAPR